MKKTFKQIVAIFVGLLLMVGNVVAGKQKPAPVTPLVEEQCAAAAAQYDCLNFASNNACLLPNQGVFVVIDSIDCAVDVLIRTENSWQFAGRFTTDVHKGRHDIKNILRPKSVMTMGNKIIVLASAQTDSSFMAVLDLDVKKIPEDIQPISRIDFSCNSFAFQVSEASQEIFVVGKNSVGYDINAVSFAEGIEKISSSATFHYHVPKQAERIQESDPSGAGLAIVAIIVVFMALVLICFIMKIYGSAIRKVQEQKPDNMLVAADGGEIYAAIAAAIHCYEEEQHDAEDTVITIQKVERAWTPWNAKFYNMNQFFANRK